MKKLFSVSALLMVLTVAGSAAQADKSAGTLRGNTGKMAPVKPTSAKAATAFFTVSKMHCEGCASGLVQAAKGWPGVKSAVVSFAQNRALVTYDPKKTNPARIAKEFKRIGFPAKPAH